jgi:DNA phosphorothioation-dependent restriction protein DptG
MGSGITDHHWDLRELLDALMEGVFLANVPPNGVDEMNLKRAEVQEQFGALVLARLDRDSGDQCPHYSTLQAEIAKLDLEDEQSGPRASLSRNSKGEPYFEPNNWV